MPRKKSHTIDYGNYHQCLLCDYRLKNNKNGLKLHIKYSHPEEGGVRDTDEKWIVCSICRKKDCKIH